RFGAVWGEQVAGAADRADHRGARRVGLDLLADARDPHVDRAIEGFAVARLSEIEEPLAREHALGVLGKGLEQCELRAPKRVFVAALVTQHAGVDVEPLGAEADRRAWG